MNKLRIQQTIKICPTCKETYKDDGLNFCLADGTTLIKKKDGAAAKHQSNANEILAFALLAFAILVFLSLVSRDPADPTFNSPSSQKVQNWLGLFGANLAELLISIVGLLSYLFPALLAVIAWRVFQSDSLKPRMSRVIGSIMLVGAASGLTSMIGWHGGTVGALFAQYSEYLLSTVWAAILLFTLLITSVLLITNISFVWPTSARDNFKIHFSHWKEKRRQGRSEQINLTQKRLEKRQGAREENDLAGDLTIPPKTATKKSAQMTELGSGKLLELDAQLGHIPISPKKQTGDLNGEASEEIQVEEELPGLSKTPQSFDDYELPSSQLLNPAAPHIEQKEKELLAIAESLSEKTKEFNVAGKVVNICPGPVVTTYEFKPDPGVKYSRVTALVDDLCLALKAESIRIDRIPGKAFVGIEVPNKKRETIQLRDVIESKKFKESPSKLTIALGKTIDGLNYVADLAKMPHLLIAGATGAGKSVGVNSLVISILYKAKPDEVKFIMVDPKRLELGLYADIPHLATPIITDPKRAAISLRWAVSEMERRYKDLAGYGVRNIDGYNAEAKKRNAAKQFNENGDKHPTLPYIVIIIDELADLMMVSGKEVEEAIEQLAQAGRAAGIHLVITTQKISDRALANLLNTNFPSRISYRSLSKADSRMVLTFDGAEQLLERGDMLFLPTTASQVIRVHGAYVDEKEIGKIVDHIKNQVKGPPAYDETITKTEDELDESGDLSGRRDPLFFDALKTVVNAKRGSTPLLQWHLRIGYGRAAAILDAMVKEGYIGDMDGSTRARPVLQKAYRDLEDLLE